MPKRKRLTEKHKKNISISLTGKGRKRSKKKRDRQNSSELLSNAEKASKIVRNLSLSVETPSKIARNASVTAKNLASVNTRLDRNLGRLRKGSSSVENLSKAFYRRQNYLLGVDRLLTNKKRFGL
jgi:hypothetical protein